MTERGLSERRALVTIGMSAAALRYEPSEDRNTELRARIVTLAHVLKCLVIVDDATTEAVAVVPARALGGLPVTRVLDRLALERGLPQVLRTDNGWSAAAARCELLLKRWGDVTRN